MTVEEIIDELESIESLLNNNELDVAKVDLYLLLKELLKTVTVEERMKRLNERRKRIIKLVRINNK